jgi:type II secretory pathway component GspD/PulD (secretin)
MMKAQRHMNREMRNHGSWQAMLVLVNLLGAAALYAQTSQPTTQPGEDALDAARRAAMASITSPTTQPAAVLPPSTRPAHVQPPGSTPANGRATLRHTSEGAGAHGKPPENPAAHSLPPQLPATPPKSPMEQADAQHAKLAASQPTTTSAPALHTLISFNVRPVDPESRTYRFDYQATPWADVLADFSRMSGLSFLNQPDPPLTELLTFRSPRSFTYQEALDQLNELLLSRPLNKLLIQREDRFLTIKRLPDLMREVPADKMYNSFEEMDRAKPGQFDIVLVNWDIPVEGWSPYDIIEKYRPMFSDTYGTQVNGKRLELTGLVREHRRFREVVTAYLKMGLPPQTDPRPSRTIALHIAKASDIQTTLRQLFPPMAPSAPGRGPGVDQTAETAKKIDIIVDTRNNTLLVKGPQRVLDEISELAAKLDQGKGPQLPIMKVIKLQYADANTLTNSLKQIFQTEKQTMFTRDPSAWVSPEEKASKERDIFADVGSNSVILLGGAEGVASAEELVKNWDVPTENQSSEIVELKHADAGQLAATLMTIFPPTPKPGQLPDRVTARTTRSLVVTATKQNLKRIRELIEKLDAPSDDEAKEHVVRLKSATPSTLAVVLQQAMMPGMGQPRVINPGNRGAGQPMPQGGQGSRYIPDDSTGVLIVYCGDKEWEQAEPLIKRLDDQSAEAKPRLENFALAKADAEDVTNLLRQMFPTQPPQPGVVKAGGPSAFFADTFNNSVQVWGTPDFIAEVGPFIKQLDIVTGPELTVIKLVHARAETIAPTLIQSISSVKGGPSMQPAQIQGGQPGRPATGFSLGGLVRIVAEPITNSLLVNAPAKELEQIKTLVASMDEAAIESRVLLEVKHRSAEELAGTMRNLATGAAAARQPGVQGAAPAAGKGVNIVAAGKQIILDGPREEVAKLIQVFDQLDVPYEQPLFRKYAVMDAEEDEKKLRTMLAMQPAAPKSNANPSPGGQPAMKVPPVSLSAPEAISIYADTFENTLLVGVKVESDFNAIETLLDVIFAEARPIKGHEDFANTSTDGFFTILLKHRKAFDVAFDAEDILNPNRKSGGIKLGELGSNERILLVQNAKPSEREKVQRVVEMFDTPDPSRKQNRRIIDSKIPPALLAKLLERNYDKPLILKGALDDGPVHVIDIHAEDAPTPATPVNDGSVTPCVLPSSLWQSLCTILGSAESDECIDEHPADCPICHQHACVIPAHLAESLSAILTTTFDDPIYEQPSSSAPTTQPEEHNHVVQPAAVDPPARSAPGVRAFDPSNGLHPTTQPAISSTLGAALNAVEAVTIIVDAETGKIIMVGPEDQLDELEDLIDELTSGDSMPVIRVFPLKFADVNTAAQLLEQVFNQGQAALSQKKGKQQPQMMPVQPPVQPGQQGQPGQQPQQGRQPQQQAMVPQAPTRIKVVPDVRTRSLMVISPAQDVPLIIDVLKKIDMKIDVQAGTLRMFRLVNLDAQQVADNLREIFSITPTARRGGRAGQPGQPQTPEQAVQQQMIQMQQGGQPGQPGQPQGATLSSTDTVKLTADSQTNTIIAQGPQDVLNMMESIIKDLEKETNTTKPEMRRLQLAHARATDIASIAKEVASATAGPGPGGPNQGGGGRGGRAGQVSVTAEPRTNSVIVAGQTKDVDRVQQIIQELDKESGGSTIKQFPVKGDAGVIAAALQKMFNSGPGQQDIVITGDAASGMVMVKAAEPQMKEIETQINLLEERVGITKEFRTVKVSVADAEAIAPKIQDIFKEVRTTRGGKANVKITGSKSAGMLYVLGADDDVFKQIERVTKDMDVAPTGLDVKRYPLRFANATETSNKLTEMMMKAMQGGNLGNTKLDLVGVTADPRTNSLVVTGGPITFSLIGKVLAEIDVVGEAGAVENHMYKVQFARASELANVVNQQLIKTKPPTPGQPSTISITPDDATNALLVSATVKDFEEISQTIAALDVENGGKRISRTFSVKYVDPGTMANILTQQFQSRAAKNPNEQVIASADYGTNGIVVSGNEKNMAEVAKIIEDTDKENTGGAKETRLIHLQAARADELANSLNLAWQARTMPNRQGKWPVSITPEMATNNIIVTAPSEKFEEITKMVAALDITSAPRVTRSFNVKYVAPLTMATILTQQFQARASRNPNDQVIAQYEDGTMSIIVSANEKNMAEVAKIIKDADKENVGGKKTTKYYSLKEARADELARAMNEAFTAKMVPNRQGKLAVTVTADIASNNLIVTAPEEWYPEIEEMITTLDVKGGDGQRERKTFKLTYADPGSVSNAIRTTFQPIGRNPTARDQVTSADDWTTNSVLVSASHENMMEIEKLIGELDKPGDAQRTEHVIELANGNPQDVATGLQQIFDAQNAGRRGRASATIRAVTGTTKIICFANEIEYEQIQSLVKQIDKVEGGRSVHTVPMPEMVPAKSVAENITKLFGTQGGRDGVKAEFHEPTNTLLVFASDAEFEKINKQVIEAVAKQPTIGAAEVYKIPLKYAVADQVAKTLQDFFDKKNGVARSGQNNMPPWMRGPETAAKQVENQITITAETTSNMLLVNCTPATKKMIDDIIKDIDTSEPPGGKSIMEMVALKYMDASEMIGILTEYLKVSQRTPSDEGKQVIPWWMDAKEQKKDEKTVLAGDMRLKAVESMNAIIVVGKPEGVAETVKKIKELDVENTESGDVPQRIAVVNGSATDIATTVNKLFNDANREKKGGASYLKPIIVAEDGTNSIIFRGSTKDFNLVKRMVEDSDQQMKDGGAAVQILAVPSGRNVEDLARTIEKQMNDAETNKQKMQKEYKPSLVSIGADLRSNALVIAGSKAKYEEAKALVDKLVSMGPAGGNEQRLIRFKGQLSPQEAKQIIDGLQNGSGSQGNQRGGTRGPRSDAEWSNPRRYEKSPGGSTIGLPAPSTMQGLFAQIAVQTAIAQPAKQPKGGPVTGTVRPRAPTTQPGVLTPEQLIKAAAAKGVDVAKLTPEAQKAIGKKLSGSPITVIEAGPDGVILDGNKEDVEVIESLLMMLDSAIPSKEIEYVPLKNAQAKNLAETLKKVFEPLQQKGTKAVRPEDKVDIIADAQTNGLYIAATADKMAQVRKLIDQNEAAAVETVRNWERYAFKNRRVMEVGEVLKKMVASYLKQKGLDPNLITIEIDPQTNSVLVSAGATDLKLVMKLIEGLDAEPPPADGDKRPMGEADVMVIPLKIAQADKMAELLNKLLKQAATGETPMKDIIRRLRILDDSGKPIETINLDRPIVVFGDPDSNSLMVASTRENALIMKHVAQAFDVEPERAPVMSQVVTLKFADATEVADQITNLLKESEALTKRPGGKGDSSGRPEGETGSLVYKAVVIPDPRTNQILVVGRPEAVPILTGIISGLDVKGLDVMPFEIVKLEYASATSLETALTAMLEERAKILPKGKSEAAKNAETVIIKGDPRARSLIIAAKPARMEELRGLIKKLDVPATALIEDIRTITLKKGSAKDLSEKLTKLWEERAKQQEAGSKGMKLETPAIVSDERSNSIIVAASKGDFEAIKSVVEKIEALELNPMANIRIVQLKYNSAKQLKAAFQTLFEKRAEMRGVDGKTRPEDKVAIEVDEVTNSLIFAGSQENFDVLLAKIAELDTERTTPGIVEYFVATNVGAQRVKDTITDLFKEGVYRPGASAESEAAKARNKVTVTVDQRANILIVSASPENMEVVREIFNRMNSVKTPWDVAITRMIDIQFGDSVKIAAQVQDYFEKLDKVRNEGAGDAKNKGGFGVTIFADERSNRVIVGGTKDGIDSAVELVGRLDVKPGSPGQVMEVYKLTEASAAKIGEMIKKVFEERNKPREGDTGSKVKNVPVTIEANATTNSLLVNASREDHILIKDLVARLDRPSTIGEMTRVIALEKATAARVKDILEELYKGAKGGGGGDDKSGSSSIAVVEDPRTNSIVVTAPPGELDNITALVKRIDETEVKGQAEIGVFAVENEDAKKMAELLNSIMTGRGGPEGSSQGTGSSGSSSSDGSGGDKNTRDASSMMISFADKDPRGREIFLRTIRENVQITYNERTNSIIAVAPPQTLRMIGQLVRKLDQIQKRAVLVKVFSMVNADATKMVQMLEDMFAADESKSDQKDFQQGRDITVEGGSSSTSGVPTAASQGGPTAKGTFGRPKTTFVADERTNSIVVAGWPEDIDVVADVIDQLDSRPIQDRENIVYSLVNATAEDVTTALKDYFDAEASRLDTLSDTVSPQRRMDQEVNIVAHEESNQLILSVSPRYKNDVLRIIEELDKAPPQVMIQVMIAEVTLDDRFEMGLEFALQELRFSETAVANANGILQSSHFDVVGGTDLGAAGSGLGGFSFTITGEDFNFLVRALQSDSRLEIIQRPMIMCQDNQQAQILIGQQVPIPQGTSSAFGQVTTAVQYQEVGVILNVEPHINPDGFVYMLVEPEISSLSDSTIQTAPGSFAPIINSRKASTNVAVKDGETVVIGGLITTRESESESKVPLLGDIPGLGVLFRTTIRTKQKTELLIALTPRVVRTVEDGRRLSIEARDESGIITPEMKQSPLMKNLQVKPESPDEIEDLDMPPETEAPDNQGYEDGAPSTEPAREGKPTYGPEVPRYGPIVPGGSRPIARQEESKPEAVGTGQ